MEDKLIKGAFIVTLGIIISKALSLFFIFPFSRMVGSVGLSLYSYAYTPYTLFIDISTLGIPLAISKMVSKYKVNGKYRSISLLLRLAFFAIGIISVVSFVVINILAPFYASKVLPPNSLNSAGDVRYVIFLVSLSLLLVPFISVFRGLFQGLNKMVVYSLSQIIEQIIRVGFILISSYFLIYVLKRSYTAAVNAAVFSAFLASCGSLFFLLIIFIRRPKYSSFEVVKKRTMLVEMIKYAIPYLVMGLNITLYNLIDSLTFNRGLSAFGENNPELIYGIFSFEINKLISIPVAIAVGFSVSLLPLITSSIEKKQKAHNMIVLSYRVVLAFLVPIVLFAMFFSDNVYHIFYNSSNEGSKILWYYAPLIIFLGINTLTNSLMQALNRGKVLLFSLTISLIIKGCFNYIFIKNLGYKGAIYLTMISLGTCILINLLHLKMLRIFIKEGIKIVLKCFIFLFIIALKQLYPYQAPNLLFNIIYLGVNCLIFGIPYYFLIKKDLK